MKKHLYTLIILFYATYNWLLNKFFELLKSKVNFATKLDEFHQDNVKLIRDIKKWEFKIVIKSKKK